MYDFEGHPLDMNFLEKILGEFAVLICLFFVCMEGAEWCILWVLVFDLLDT